MTYKYIDFKIRPNQNNKIWNYRNWTSWVFYIVNKLDLTTN